MAELKYFHILKWKKNEENQHVRRNLVFSNSDGFTSSSDVPILKAPQTKEREVGYRSQVILAVSPAASHAFMALLAKHPKVQEMCSQADTYTSGYEQDGDWLVYWDGIKWYDGYPEVAVLNGFVEALDADDLSDYGEANNAPSTLDRDDVTGTWHEHFRFLRVGEDYEDVEDRGHAFDDIMLNRAVSF